MKKYDQYKNSGVEWLGEIPEHWGILSFRHCIKKLTDYTSNGSFAALANNVQYLSNGYSRLIRLTDLRVNLINEGVYVSEKSHNFLKNSELYGGELLIANVGAYAGLSLVMPDLKFKSTLGPNMFLLKLNQNVNFYNYLLSSSNYSNLLTNIALASAQPKLNKENIRNIKVILPTQAEQTAIADFLDDKTTKIDQAIAIKQQQIELLKERRQILIHKAVTQGINPNVKLKDSGVKWIGMIPEHWEVKRLKHFINIQGGFAFNSSHFKDEGVQIIKIANTYMNELCLNRQPTFVEKSFLKTHKEWIVSKGDILMSLTGTLGKKDYGFAILIEDNEQYLLNQRVAKITMKKGVEPDYILNILRSEMYLNQLYMLPSGTKQANLSNDNVMNIKVAFPTNQIERITILEYIKNVTTKIATAISLKEQEIEKLKEYKMSLIDGVVTGKVKVN